VISRSFPRRLLVASVIANALLGIAFAQESSQTGGEVSFQDLAAIQGQITHLKRTLVKQAGEQHTQVRALDDKLASTNKEVGVAKQDIRMIEADTETQSAKMDEIYFKIMCGLAILFGLSLIQFFLIRSRKFLVQKQESVGVATSKPVSHSLSVDSAQGGLEIITTKKVDSIEADSSFNQQQTVASPELAQLLVRELGQTQDALNQAKQSFMQPVNISLGKRSS